MVQNLMYAALSIAVLVIAGATVMLVSGVLREARKLGRTAEDLSSLMKTTEDELAQTTQHARNALLDVNRLVVELTETVRHVDNAAASIERVADTVETASSALKIVKTSTDGLASVYEGIKQGIKVLRGPQQTDKEGTTK